MKTLILTLTLLFSLSLAEAGIGTGKKRTRPSAFTKKITFSGEKKYKKHHGKNIIITNKMFKGENIR